MNRLIALLLCALCLSTPGPVRAQEATEEERPSKLTPEQERKKRRIELDNAREELPESAKPALVLLDDFRDREFRVWSSLRERLVAMGADALPALRLFLRELDWETRAFAASCLGDMGDKSVAADLADAFAAEKFTEARRQMVLAIANLEAPSAKTTLLAACAEEDAGVRLAGVRGLARLGDADLAPHIAGFVDDKELDIRYEARGALAELGDKDALAGLLKEARALVADRKAQRANSEPLEDNEVRYTQYLLGISIARARDKAADKLLMAALLGEKPWGHKVFFRMGVAEGLGRRSAGGEKPHPALVRGISHREKSVRVACTYGAIYVGSDDLVKPLVRALQDSQLDVRHNAAIALGQIGTEDAAKALRTALKDKAGEVRIGAVRALTLNDHPDATKALTVAARDRKYMIRVQAVRALAQRTGEEGVLDALLKAAKDPDYGVRMQALAALAHHHEVEPVIGAIVKAMEDRDFGVQANACLALATLRDRGPVDEHEGAAQEGVGLWLKTKQERLKRAALEYLDAVRPPAAVPYLLDALGNEQEETRRRANLALMKMSETSRNFSPSASASERSAAQKRWRLWWEEVGGKLPKRGTRSRIAVTGDFVDAARDLKWKGLDIAILFDSTFSMAALTSAVKERIDEIILQLQELLPSLRVSVYTYRDDTDDYMYYGSPLTYDMWKLTGFLQNAIHGQGRDIPEAVFQVVKNSTKALHWRPGAHKVVVYMGDAPHHPEMETAFLSSIEKFFTRENQAVLHAIFTDTNRRSLDIAVRKKRYDPESFHHPFFEKFKLTAKKGRGKAILLDDESALIKELLILTFGEAWRGDIENLLDFEI